MWMRSVLFVTLAVLSAVQAQLPIPGKPPGFVYGKGSAGAGVQLESYIDLLCPDSKSAFPGLKKLAEYYEPDQFRLTFVLFPLPYHQHAFAAAESTFTITAALGDKAFEPWLETIYANQDAYWNKPTKDLSPVQVSDKLFALAQKTFPSLTKEQWSEGMSGHGGTFADDAARVAWKYTCSRGKSGTPLYTLNGVPFDADATWSFEDWLKVIDPLVKANTPKVAEAELLKDAMTQFRGVPSVPDRQVTHLLKTGDAVTMARVCEGIVGGHRPCEFLPGRAMCCQFHEACVLRSGCVAL
ncbi:hypothetical protein Poli38472_008857 [Pythium oligandrum]|uniref:Thioredoxin-like fold domain-containing protein n=1 Tax=Pythium oligandrum TaxID=41045 RepID=A0A8K1C4B8_PYTOL|nr:hypothetical protein Poli38472_008857 [Pythium oligandrum]|eukprot:TMW56209.1 hypothetical protein Poli38472_008857 [Pythium oligandrum]